MTAARSETPSISRRRLVQYVGLSWQDILAPKDKQSRRRDPEDGQLGVVTQLRLEHAFGDFRSAASGRARTLLNLREGRQLDLLYAYLEGRKIARVLDFRIGRQLDPAQLDFFALDGLSLSVSPPGVARRYLKLTLWGGAQVRSDSPLGWANIAFEAPDEFLDPRTQPKERGYLLGAAVSTRPRSWISARAGVRRAFRSMSQVDPNQVLIDPDPQLPAFSSGVEQSLTFAQLSVRSPNRRVFFNAAASYDLIMRELSLADLALSAQPAPKHRLRLSWLRTTPILDLDSIFAIFDRGAFQEWRLRHAWTIDQRWQLATQVQVRNNQDPQASKAQAPGVGAAMSGALQLRHHRATLHTRMHRQNQRWQLSGLAQWQWQPKGSSWSVDLWVHHAQALMERRRHALSGALSANYRLFSGVSVRAMVETLTNQDVRQSTRVFGALTMDANLRVGGR